MDAAFTKFSQLAGTAKHLALRLLAVAGNRLELLMLETQEERERLLQVILLALGAAVFGLLAGVALTVAVVIFFWEHSPLAALLVLTVFYALCAVWLYTRFMKLRQDWQSLPGTLHQLQKDRECLERILR